MLKALCLFRDQFAHIKPVEVLLSNRINFVYTSDWTVEVIEREQPDIVIGINEYHAEMAKCYQYAKSKNIPTLTIQDGILEWRFMFENPIYDADNVGVPMHYPVLADKYACIGHSFAHIIAELGNYGKVEITGMPRLDIVNKEPKPNNERKKILVISTSKPWFNEDQEKVSIQSLKDLRDYFDTREDIEPIWRVTKTLFLDLNVKSSFKNKETKEIVEQIKESDAVIAMPGTAVLEAMRVGRPTAQIDYFNIPKFVFTAWNIFHKSHIHTVVDQLLCPTNRQMWVQETFLRSMCIPDSNSADRVAELIRKMIVFRKEQPNTSYPRFLITPLYIDNQMPSEVDFYPNREVFKITDENWLKAAIIRLERENSEMKKQLEKRSFGGILLSSYNKLIRKKLEKLKK